MAQIPVYEGGQTDVRSAGVVDSYATAEQMGAGIGRALQGLGNTLQSLSVDFKREKDKQDTMLRNERVAQSVADSSIKMSEINADIQTKAPADGSGVKDSVYKSQLELIEKQAAEIQDPVARSQYKIKMLGDLAGYAQNNVQFELERGIKNTTDRSNFALNGLENAVRTNPGMWDKHMSEGVAIIDAQTVPDGQKENMKREWVQRTAYARFQGLTEAAKSPEDFDAITKELQQPKWQDAFKPEEYNSVLNDIAQSKKVFTTQAATQARATLDGIESRLREGVAVDPAELSQASSMAEGSSDPIIMKRALRATRDSQIIERSKKMTSTQLQVEADRRLGEGYPNMTPRLADAAEKANKAFPGISPGFFGAVSNMEYGVYMTGTAAKGNPKFAPRAVSAKVDVTGLRPRTADALSIAGQIYGAPLPLVSAYRSQAYQNQIRMRGNPNRRSVAEHSHHTSGTAVDISTAGMSGADKGKLVDALVQAGFTGFGEYGTHIHTDMRARTTRGFNPRTGELGWSKGSPEVVAALVNRGYSADAPANSLKRGNAAMVDTTDYGQGPVGGGTSAIGVNQWTEKSFLAIMRDPKIAQRIGLPPNLSDAQLLDLRKDPDWSFMATGAYAEQNKAYLENSLGREVNDAELYMAHFLGPGGAQTLLSAYKNNPDANAAELMPNAAKNNPSRFFDKNGKAMSVRDVYDNIAVKFSTAPNQVQFEDAQTYKRQAENARKREQSDPMTLYSNNVVNTNDLNAQGGFATRGAMALAAGDYYSIPKAEMKPFTADEATDYSKQIADGSLEQKLSLLGNINEMDKAAPGMGQAAMAQIGQKDTAYAYAGAVLSERDDLPTAEMVVRGADRLKQDKNLSETLFAGKEAYTAFGEATSNALGNIPQAQKAAVFEAAKAYYAERMAQQGKFEFDPDEFKKAAIKVAAGDETAIGDVNGTPTMLPPGVTEDTFNAAIDNLTDADLIKFGADGAPPIDITGAPVPAQDIAKEGTFVFIGGTSYKIRMLDGNFLVTGDTDGKGRLAAYVFNADPKAIEDVAARPPEMYITPEEQDRAMKQWQYQPPTSIQPPDSLKQLLGN